MAKSLAVRACGRAEELVVRRQDRLCMSRVRCNQHKRAIGPFG